MPAMRHGGTLTVDAPLSPRLLRGQWEYQGLQRAWSRGWEFGGPVLQEVDVRAPQRDAQRDAGGDGVAALFSGGVDSWATVIANPDITHLVFVRGFDIGVEQTELGDTVEARLRASAAELGLPLVTVQTNLRELSDEIIGWERFYGCAAAAVSLLLAPSPGACSSRATPTTSARSAVGRTSARPTCSARSASSSWRTAAGSVASSAPPASPRTRSCSSRCASAGATRAAPTTADAAASAS